MGSTPDHGPPECKHIRGWKEEGVARRVMPGAWMSTWWMWAADVRQCKRIPAGPPGRMGRSRAHDDHFPAVVVVQVLAEAGSTYASPSEAAHARLLGSGFLVAEQLEHRCGTAPSNLPRTLRRETASRNGPRRYTPRVIAYLVTITTWLATRSRFRPWAAALRRLPPSRQAARNSVG